MSKGGQCRNRVVCKGARFWFPVVARPQARGQTHQAIIVPILKKTHTRSSQRSRPVMLSGRIAAGARHGTGAFGNTWGPKTSRHQSDWHLAQRRRCHRTVTLIDETDGQILVRVWKSQL